MAIPLKNQITVINFDLKPQTKRCVEIFPDVLRCGIFGPSGIGKSNVLLTILLHIKPFWSLYLCSKTAYQDKYKLLSKLVADYNKKTKTKIKFRELSIDDLPEPEDIEKNAVIVFDDILTENQDKIANFFLRGRHRDISCFYLSQSYTKIPKKSAIRSNFNYLILFSQDLINLRQIFIEYVTDLNFEQFRKWCSVCWKEPYGFLTIDLHGKHKYMQKFESTFKKV